MSTKGKFSLINIDCFDNFEFQEGDKIVYEMPSFCSGDYEAIVKKDPKYGLYIDEADNHFDGCRDFEVYRDNKRVVTDEEQRGIEEHFRKYGTL